MMRALICTSLRMSLSTCLNPAAAFREIARTLRPGGAHVFTTPLVRKNELIRFCARLAPDGTIAHLIEPREYHRNPMSSEGSLVTVNWGYDIANYVFKACGLFTNLVFIYNIELGIRVEHMRSLLLVTYKPLVLRSSISKPRNELLITPHESNRSATSPGRCSLVFALRPYADLFF